MIRIITSLFAALVAVTPAFAQSQEEKPVSIVLVHGAFVDASGWRAVHDILIEDGYEVLVVQNATVTLEDDVAATERAIAASKYPVVLVGHSYGGAVITEAGDNPKVQSLVYLAAFAPDIGESVLNLAETPTPGESGAPLLPPADDFVIVDPEKFPAAFAADIDVSTTRFMAAAQVPWGLQALGTPLSKAAWKVKPASFMIAAQDKMIPPSAQRAMANRAGGDIIEIRSSHAVMLSHAREVAAFIEAHVADAR